MQWQVDNNSIARQSTEVRVDSACAAGTLLMSPPTIIEILQ